MVVGHEHGAQSSNPELHISHSANNLDKAMHPTTSSYQ